MLKMLEPEEAESEVVEIMPLVVEGASWASL